MTQPRTREQPQTNPPRKWWFEWGGVGFHALEPEPGFGFAESPSEVLSIYVDDLTAGLRSFQGISDWTTEDRLYYYANTGLYGLWLPSPVGVKSYAITTQTGVVSVDHSSFNSGNRRIHSAMWPTSSGQRFIAGALAQIYTDTSVSNPAITTPSTADNVTDDVMSMSIGRFGGSTVLAIVTDGQSDDAKYTTDPTANSISWTSLITYPNAADEGYWLYFVPTLGDGGRWVFCGKLNNGTPALYAFKPSDTAPLTISTMQPVPYEANKDLEGDIATVTITDKDPIDVGETGSGSGDAAGRSWQDVGNILTSDDMRAIFETSLVGDVFATSKLVPYGFDISSKPKSGLSQAASFTVEHSVDNTNFDSMAVHAQIVLDGTPVGTPKAISYTDSTSDATETFGATDDDWNITPQAFKTIALHVWFTGDGPASSGNDIRVDHIRMTNLKYRFPGVQVETTEGAWSIGPMPTRSNFIPEIKPVSDDATGLDTRRELVVYELLYDEQDRVTVNEVHRPDTGLATIVAAGHFQGGLVAFGTSAVGSALKAVWTRLEGGIWVTDVLNFPGTHDGQVQDVYMCVQQDKDLIVGTCNADGTDRQLWKLNLDTGWHPFGALQSISGETISSVPLRWAETVLNEEQNFAYAGIPDGSSNLDFAREFVPPDLNADPREVNTSQAKVAQATRVTLLQQNYDSPNSQGPWFKVLLNSQHNNDEIDSGSSFDTVRHLFDQGGDFDFGTTDAYDNTFSSGFTPNFIASGGLPFNHGIIGIEAGASSGAKTPNILPALFRFASQTESDRVFPIRLAPAPEQDLHDIVKRLETAKRADPVRALIFPSGFPYLDQDGNRNVPCLFSYENGVLIFREVPGAA